MSNEQPSIEDLIGGGKREEDSTEEKLRSEIDSLTIKKKEELVKTKAESQGETYINLFGFAIGPEALKLIPLEECEKHQMVSFLLLEGNVRIGAIDPHAEGVQEWAENVRKENNVKVEIYWISNHSLEAALKIYRKLPKVKKAVEGVEISDEDVKKFTANLNNLKDFAELLKKETTSNLMILIIAAAVKMRASDIHFEPSENRFTIRFRIDGMLHDIVDLDEKQKKLVTSRVKLLSELKINITDRPQDGRFTIYLQKDRVDVRVSALPTNYGETLTLRLLASSLAKLKLDDLGFNKDAFRIIEQEISKPNGMIVSTGPTGSGKTTTLYAVLNKIKTPQSKIITIEDPIEYRMEGISQSQVNAEKDYTFAKGLKSLVRQDPDILMVGEMRDTSTVEIAIQAALTGHLLLTTLHTNQATGAVARMMALGAKPFLLAPAMNVIIGQRLVRQLCQHCKKEEPLDEETLKKVTAEVEKWPEGTSIPKPDLASAKFYSPVGCKECQDFGYWGRIGIYEVVQVTNEMKDAIMNEKTAEHQLNELARKQGTISLMQDGILKVLNGTTSMKEVYRVVV